MLNEPFVSTHDRSESPLEEFLTTEGADGIARIVSDKLDISGEVLLRRDDDADARITDALSNFPASVQRELLAAIHVLRDELTDETIMETQALAHKEVERLQEELQSAKAALNYATALTSLEKKSNNKAA